jgi:hypothetical protein
MLSPINERSERALERWEKLRKSLGRAVSSVRPVQKGRFTVETYMSPMPRLAKPGKYKRFQVVHTKPTKNTRYHLQKKRNKIQKAVNAVKNANRIKYQQAFNTLKMRHKAEMNAMEKRHQKNENALYNTHFANKNKKISRLLQALNNINSQLA